MESHWVVICRPDKRMTNIGLALTEKLCIVLSFCTEGYQLLRSQMSDLTYGVTPSLRPLSGTLLLPLIFMMEMGNGYRSVLAHFIFLFHTLSALMIETAKNVGCIMDL